MICRKQPEDEEKLIYEVDLTWAVIASLTDEVLNDNTMQQTYSFSTLEV